MTPDHPHDGDPIGIGASASDDDSWMPDGPEPTDLILLWPDESLPAPSEVISALERALNDELDRDESFEPDNDAEWVVAVDGAKLVAPLVLWAERAHPVPEELGLGAAARDVRWVIGLETLIHPTDPLTSYTSLLRLLAHSFPHSPAMLDLASMIWRSRGQLESLFLREDIEPSASVLWTVHTVGEAQGGPERPIWLHTHGLARCARPELELVEIPLNQARAAFELLQLVAMSALEHGAPAAGEPFDVGLDAIVALQSWDRIVPSIEPTAPGGHEDRDDADESSHVGVRAVICDPAPRGADQQVWSPPIDLISRIERNEAILFSTERESNRQAALAQQTWDQFATAFASWARAGAGAALDPARVSFGVKVGFDVNGERDEDGHPAREHMWVELERVDGAGATGALINRPHAVRGYEEGQLITVCRDDVSDWRVATPRGAFGPEQLDELWEAIDALRGDAANEHDDESEARA